MLRPKEKKIMCVINRIFDVEENKPSEMEKEIFDIILVKNMEYKNTLTYTLRYII